MQDSISLRHHIASLQRNERGWRIIAQAGGRESVDEHAALIIAIPAHDLTKLRFEGVNIPSFSELTEIYYPPVASVVLGFRREEVKHPLDGFGVLVPEAERMNILGTIFSSSLFPGRAPEGHVTLTSYLGGARAPGLATSSEDILVENTLMDLRSLLGVTGAPTYRHTFVFKKAIPQYNVGYGRFKDLMARTEAAAPGLLVGGHSRNGISLGDSIASGQEMAERVQKYLLNLKPEIHSEKSYASPAKTYV
jgi:oxygen-dependent protoporphyrinogen oxidase